MSEDHKNAAAVRRIKKLGEALGAAWGRCGYSGPPRFVMLVRDPAGGWRIASTEEDPADVLHGALNHRSDETIEAIANYTYQKDLG